MGICEGKRGFPMASSTLPGPAPFFSNFSPVYCGIKSSQGVSVAGSRWGVALTILFRCPLAPSAPCPPPVESLSARRRRFWFWIEGPSCHSAAQVSHWRSWVFSWVDSAQRRHVERAPCTWPLGREKVAKC